MSNNWQKVFDSADIHRAEIVKAVLEERGVEAVVINKKISMINFGEYEVHVNRDHVIKAIKIISDEIKFE